MKDLIGGYAILAFFVLQLICYIGIPVLVAIIKFIFA